MPRLAQPTHAPTPAIDLRSEDLFTLAQAAALKLWPRRRGGKRVHLATLYRWASRGVAGVQLETVMVGAVRCTTREACERFIVGVTRARRGVPAPQSERANGRRLSRVESELVREGL